MSTISNKLSMRDLQKHALFIRRCGCFCCCSLSLALCSICLIGRSNGPLLRISSIISYADSQQQSGGVEANHAKPIDGQASGWYRAVLSTLIRSDVSLNSTAVQAIPMGKFVHVVEQRGRRVRVDYPANGWTSIMSSRREPILLWDEPEAYGKSLVQLQGSELLTVLQVQEVLRVHQLKEQHTKRENRLKSGILKIVNRIASGELGKDLSHGLSAENLRNVERQAESKVVEAERTTEQILNDVVEQNTTAVQKDISNTPLGNDGSELFGQLESTLQLEQATRNDLDREAKLFQNISG
eukprot:TRINITY_DN7408_c1_g1_i1.p1 TRINITY_DN7408_c1_g1~~TRINITY_DN7408_c1_g1_i1.p1  ORF type:complete len:297 (+),score=46.92 TRINITY_DN7408_c1_g1_i1:31-921(+)